MSDATYYNWKAKYAGLTVSEFKRLKSLEDENRRSQAVGGRPVSGYTSSQKISYQTNIYQDYITQLLWAIRRVKEQDEGRKPLKRLNIDMPKAAPYN
jgi:hypothetical protein